MKTLFHWAYNVRFLNYYFILSRYCKFVIKLPRRRNLGLFKFEKNFYNSFLKTLVWDYFVKNLILIIFVYCESGVCDIFYESVYALNIRTFYLNNYSLISSHLFDTETNRCLFYKVFIRLIHGRFLHKAVWQYLYSKLIFHFFSKLVTKNNNN